MKLKNLRVVARAGPISAPVFGQQIDETRLKSDRQRRPALSEILHSALELVLMDLNPFEVLVIETGYWTIVYEPNELSHWTRGTRNASQIHKIIYVITYHLPGAMQK